MNDSHDILTVKSVAKVLGKDEQTIRYLISNQLVPWGISYRNPGSRRNSYIIFEPKFFESTGIKIRGGRHDGE